jgi:hypothetical protein
MNSAVPSELAQSSPQRLKPLSYVFPLEGLSRSLPKKIPAFSI